jgi:SAM-dependent methyltransferase
VDVKQPLPFVDESYPVIVASLCLHYFSWQQTLRILSEIKRCLEQDGWLLARFNSTHDVHFGAVGFREIEPDFYSVGGKSKRFFDRQTLRKLLSRGWEIRSLEEMTIARYEKPKVVWEVVAQRRAELSGAVAWVIQSA